MSVRLLDFLIEIADPKRFCEFQRDPNAAMTAAGLTHGDRMAVNSHNYGTIRYQAMHDALDIVGEPDVSPDPALIELDFVHIEINHQHETDHLIALLPDAIRRRFGPHTTFFPENDDVK